jgi:hypothetical protein
VTKKNSNSFLFHVSQGTRESHHTTRPLNIAAPIYANLYEFIPRVLVLWFASQTGHFEASWQALWYNAAAPSHTRDVGACLGCLVAHDAER